MGRWLKACSVQAVEEGKSMEVVLEDRIVALYRTGDEFFALDGVCPHQGGPLGRGAVRGRMVTCPWHGWQFDVASGVCRHAPSVVQTSLPTQIKDGDVWIELPDVC